MNESRRHFVRVCAGLSAGAAGILSQRSIPLAATLAGIAALADKKAYAADTSGYKALVCVFFNGGSDMHNWVVPTDPTGYSEYAGVRRNLAVPRSALLDLSASGQSTGRTFGLHPDLGSIRSLYENGNAAVLANVGTLDAPTTKADFQSGNNLPSKLFSHNDQQAMWLSGSPEGAFSGWGGRMGDILMAANANPLFTALSATGNAVFLSGSSVAQFQVSGNGPVGIPTLKATSINGSTGAPAALASIVADAGADDMQYEYARIVQRSIAANEQLGQAMAGGGVAPLAYSRVTASNGAVFTGSEDALTRQLNVVAQIVGASGSLGMRRQVFMVSMGGFDTHARQMRDQPVLAARVNHAIGQFMASLRSVGMENNVTLFTGSDFGRSLTTNGSGSDHGWGSHHFVVGGAVQGKRIYGKYPLTALNTETDVGSGRLLPTTAVVQYAATLGRWMGLSEQELSDVLPTLPNFGTQGLGFV